MPAKADSQFYVTLAATPRLDKDYTVFGKVTSGMEVVEKIPGRRPHRADGDQESAL